MIYELWYLILDTVIPCILQLDSLKSNTQSQIIQFTTQVDQFHQRWQQERLSDKFLQSDGQNFDQYVTLLRNSRSDWNAITQSQNRLK